MTRARVGRRLVVCLVGERLLGFFVFVFVSGACARETVVGMRLDVSLW
jgi:hypothetical protein